MDDGHFFPHSSRHQFQRWNSPSHVSSPSPTKIAKRDAVQGILPDPTYDLNNGCLLLLTKLRLHAALFPVQTQSMLTSFEGRRALLRFYFLAAQPSPSKRHQDRRM